MEIVWHGPVLERSGYASLARSAVRGLRRRGAVVTVSDTRIDPRVLVESIVDPDDLHLWSRALGWRSRAAHPPHLRVSCHTPFGSDGHDAFARAARNGSGAAPHAGLTMFEADRLPRSWVAACNDLDRVWVPSTFNREVFINSGVEASRVEVVHPGIPNWWIDAGTRRVDAEPRSLVFLSVFKWEWRKGWDVLLRAYLRAFERADESLLVIRSSAYPAGGPSVVDRVRRFVADEGYSRRDAPRIEVIEGSLSDADMVALYRRADAFVLPSRGEGLGLPYLEAMAAGLPVIATAWSGCMDFLTADNSFLVGIEGLEPVGDNGYPRSLYEPTMRWASPSVDDTIAQLRRVAEDPVAAAAKGARASADVRARWTEDHAGSRYFAAAERAVATGLRRTTPPSSARASIRLIGSVYGVSSFTAEARAFLRGMGAAGVMPAAIHFRTDLGDASLEPADRRFLERCLARRTATAWVDVQHFPAPALSEARAPGVTVTVARTTTSLTALDPAVVGVCRTFDEVWVPSEAQRRQLVAAGLDGDRVLVVATGLDQRFLFHRSDHDRRGPGFTFLCMSEWSGWHLCNLLIDAFALEFSTDGLVALRIKARPASAGPLMRDQLRRRVDRLGLRDDVRSRVLSRIVIDLEPTPDELMPQVYRDVGAFVDLGCGSGLGRSLLEAAAGDLAIVAMSIGHDHGLVDTTSASVVDIGSSEAPRSRGGDSVVEATRAALRAVVDGDRATLARRLEMRRRVATNPTTTAVAGSIVDRCRLLLGL